MYNKLIVWGGTYGEVGATANRYLFPRDEAKRMPVSARIGASSDTLDVWAVQANIVVGGLSETQEDLDENAVTVQQNTDDDNQNGMADVQESNGALGLGVMYEDDLLPVTFDLAPRGVPVGELALALPAGGAFAACAYENKAGGRLASLSWDLAVGPAPAAVALEGVSQVGPSAVTLQYRLGSTTLSADSAKVQCGAPSTSGAGVALRAYATQRTSVTGLGGLSAQSSGLAIESAYQPVSNGVLGGQAKVALEISLPAYAWIQGIGASFRIEDQYAPEEIYGYSWMDIRLGAGWYHAQPGVSPDEWEPYANSDYYGGPPTFARPVEDEAIRVAKFFDWDTRVGPTLVGYAPPMGHNGTHTVRIAQRLTYDEQWVETDTLPICLTDPEVQVIETGPKPLDVDVRNLVIEQNSITTNATIDYLKYDPDSENPALREPSMSFQVSDAETDGHTFHYVIFMQPTGASGFDKLPLDSTRWVHGDFSIGGGSSTTVNVTGQKMLESSAFSEGWGTYTFDVGVLEYDRSGYLVDWFYYNRTFA